MRNTPYANPPRLPEGPEVELGALVPGTGEVLLEIGSGRGAFTRARAAQCPDERLIAVEYRRKWAQILDEQLQARGLANARCFADDAVTALPRLRPDASVHRVAIHFPDPWWKKRHERRLVVRDELVAELARLVVPGGIVFVQTDVEERAERYRERLEACADFVNVAGAARWVDESPFAPARSNRETRTLANGLPIWRMVFRRRGAGGAG